MRKLALALFFVILGLPLFGTNYYVKNGGSDGASGLSHANAWATISRADNLTGDQSDNLVLFNCGDTWRESWTLACSGTSGHPFTIGAYYYDTSEHRGVSGNRPRILGSNQVTTWTDTGDGVRWVATHSHTTSRWVWFINTNGTIRWGQKKASSALCVAEYDYYDTGTQIYCYAATDPDSRYTSVEAGSGSTCITKNSKFNITVENLEIAYWHNRGIYASSDGQSGDANWTIDNCWVHHIGYYADNPSDCDGIGITNKGIWIKNNIINDCVDHGVYFFTNGNGDKITSGIIEDNVFSNCYHSCCDVMCGSGQYFTDVYIRRNLFYWDVSTYDLPYATRGLYMSNGPGGWTNVIASYNIFINPVDSAIKVFSATDIQFYNNVIYGFADPAVKSGTYDNSQFYIGTSGPVTGIVIKNNIAVGAKTGYPCFYITGTMSTIAALDNNLWYQPSGGTRVYVQIGGTSYHYDDYATYATAVASKGEGGVNHDLWEDPHFVNAGGTTDIDYKITASSPCKDAGTSVNLTEDYWGNGVPYGVAPDIGFFEYQGVGVGGIRFLPGTIIRVGPGTKLRIIK